MRILEELHYHSVNDNAYISNLKKELEKKGFDVYDEGGEDGELFKLSIKKEFKKTSLYQEGKIFLNKQVRNKNEEVKSFGDLGVRQSNITHDITTGYSADEAVFAESESAIAAKNEVMHRNWSLQKMEFVVRKAMAQNGFYNFNNLKEYFPHVSSAREFATSKDYLGGLEITFSGRKELVDNPPNRDKLAALTKLLEKIEQEVKANTFAYRGTDIFSPEKFKDIFIDKTLNLRGDSEKAKGQKDILADKDWYVFNANYGTSEERKFVLMMSAEIENLREKHKAVYLVRNEQHFKIFSFKDGAGYAPDFVLFLEKKSGESITYQIFIEPKGKHLQEYDKWKEDFLLEIEKKRGSFITLGESKDIKIIGLPFYNSNDENPFKTEMYAKLEQYKGKKNPTKT